MIKKCVQKPFTVFVAVVVALTLGFVSITRMTTDLLPEMSLPYMIVITTYPGASPEKVESEVTEPLESALGTVSGVETVTSTSAENYSMVVLQFEDDTDMDSAMVKVNSAIQETQSSLPDLCGTPNVMEINMDMMATMYVSVSYDGKDIYELSDFVEETLAPYFERQDGVASVTTLGLVEQTIEVRLNQEKIDEINAKLLEQVNSSLADAKQQIEDGQTQIDDARAQIEEGQAALEEQKNSTATQLGEATLALNQAIATQSAYQAQVTGLQANQTALQMELDAYREAGVEDSYNQINEAFQSILDAVDAQAMVTATQTLADRLYEAGLLDEQITVTSENVDSVIDELTALELGDSEMSEELSALLSSGVKSAITALVEQQTEEYKAQLPTDVEDAIENPEKLTYVQSLLEEQEQAELAENLTVDNLTTLSNIVTTRIPQIETELANLETELLAAEAALEQVNSAVSEATASYSEVEASKILAAAGFGSADAQLQSSLTLLEESEAQLESAQESYENAKETALKSANLDSLLTLDTLSTLIYAQNFSMPAGYIDDENDQQWLLKVGEEYDSVEDLTDMVLCSIDGIGDVTLGSVADLTVIDNAGDSYTKVNGQNAVVLSIFKGSTAGTSDVSKACNEAITEAEERYEGLDIQPLMDQGQYISMILESVVQDMVGGALLAILVLAIFLKDARPTIVVAFSIPFSVIIALLVMYFTGITLNVMSLGGLGLGIGMLVDNSVVAIENIYRLRGRGLPPARAAVQGAKQVAGPIIASTLTTICVFLPMIFTTGYTRELLFPLALTITYTLVASLVVALTVVPTVSSTLLKNSLPKGHPLFDRVLDGYGKVLDWCLRVKWVPLTVSGAFLALSVFAVVQMGMVLIPDISSNQIAVTVTMPDDVDQDTSYATADAVMERILAIDGVSYVGAMNNTSSLLTSSASTTNDLVNYAFYVVPDDDLDTSDAMEEICDEITETTADLDCTVVASASAMGEMDTMLGSGLSISIYGEDADTLIDISEDFIELASEVEGFTNFSNGQEEADETLVLTVDKDAAMRLGLTTAQIYSSISSRLTTEATATTVTVDDHDMEVSIVNENDPLTRENLLDMTFDVETTDDDGNTVTETHTLSEFAMVTTSLSIASVSRENQTRYVTVMADTEDGYNTTRLAEKVRAKLADYELPEGYSWELGGEYDSVTNMMEQMIEMLLLGLLFIYLVMVAQFQSFLSPFIILFTVPLAFTGGMFGLVLFGEQLSLLSMIGFLVLMGTVVNNGIVFVDYVNQLRLGGMEKRPALIATGKTRMRPILMTALTTILAMVTMIFSTGMSGALGRGMAIVVAFGLAYATLMTLFIVPIMYDLLYRKQPHVVDVGGDEIDDAPDDAAEFLAEALAEERAKRAADSAR